MHRSIDPAERREVRFVTRELVPGRRGVRNRHRREHGQTRSLGVVHRVVGEERRFRYRGRRRFEHAHVEPTSDPGAGLEPRIHRVDRFGHPSSASLRIIRTHDGGPSDGAQSEPVSAGGDRDGALGGVSKISRRGNPPADPDRCTSGVTSPQSWLALPGPFERSCSVAIRTHPPSPTRCLLAFGCLHTIPSGAHCHNRPAAIRIRITCLAGFARCQGGCARNNFTATIRVRITLLTCRTRSGRWSRT